MNTIDWSKAPKGFPLWLEGLGEHAKHSGWYRRSGEVFKHESHGQFLSFREGQFFIVHTKPELEQWTGEGLPPVGTVCEILTLKNDWVRVVVVAVTDYRIYCEETVIGTGFSGPDSYDPVKKYARFRQIRTPEQIAEDDRENGIDELARKIAGISGRETSSITEAVIARILYDAGYHKQVKS